MRHDANQRRGHCSQPSLVQTGLRRAQPPQGLVLLVVCLCESKVDAAPHWSRGLVVVVVNDVKDLRHAGSQLSYASDSTRTQARGLGLVHFDEDPNFNGCTLPAKPLRVPAPFFTAFHGHTPTGGHVRRKCTADLLAPNDPG